MYFSYNLHLHLHLKGYDSKPTEYVSIFKKSCFSEDG